MKGAPIEAVELFAGIGGFRIACDRVGIRTQWANDLGNHSGGHGRMRVSGSENPGLVWFELLRTPIEGLKPY
ncbi:MAG: hypothetical protein ACO34J_13475 [Prochlorothrix sp.]